MNNWHTKVTTQKQLFSVKIDSWWAIKLACQMLSNIWIGPSTPHQQSTCYPMIDCFCNPPSPQQDVFGSMTTLSSQDKRWCEILESYVVDQGNRYQGGRGGGGLANLNGLCSTEFATQGLPPKPTHLLIGRNMDGTRWGGPIVWLGIGQRNRENPR